MLFSKKNAKAGAKQLVTCMLAMLMLFSACGSRSKTTRVVLTTGFAKDEVFKIESMSCRVPEILLYLVTVKNQYAETFGKEIFEVSLNGVSLEENLKETVLARIAQVKTLNLMAQDKKVTLDDAEKKSVQEAAEEFFKSLNETEIEELGLSEKIVTQMYTEYALAEKLYAYIIKDINPEISDDEARIVTVEQICLKTYTKDGSGRRVEYSGRAKEAAREKIEEAYSLVMDGSHDFESVAAQYSEQTNIEISFGKGEVSEALEQAAFNMSTGQISGIIEDEDGYYILKCINTFNKEETDQNKLKIMEQRKQEVFGEEYDSYVETLTRILNEKLWNEISCPDDPEVSTSDFFRIYKKYFPEI